MGWRLGRSLAEPQSTSQLVSTAGEVQSSTQLLSQQMFQLLFLETGGLLNVFPHILNMT